MDILIIGSRGREHSLALALKKDPRVNNIFCIPGNGGLSGITTCIKIDIFDFEAILEFLDANPSIELTLVSPDELLAKGLVGYLSSRGHRAFGCDEKCARLETDKSFACWLCREHEIPAPDYKIFDDYLEAKRYVRTRRFPIVIKTNGRTGGKGILFCQSIRDAENALYDTMVVKLFGASGERVDIEEFVSGKNIMIMAFADGETIVPLPAVENYRRVYDGNVGMSTAGMGASIPSDIYTPELEKRAYDEIVRPTLDAMREEGMEYRGVIGFNVIVCPDGCLKVTDFVSRFCDVEGQILIPLIETPILDIIEAIVDGRLKDVDVRVRDCAGVCVVTTSGGYPLDYNRNARITIGDDIDPDVMLFHAGTKISGGELKTSGGRVISVVSYGETKAECAERVYANIAKIAYDGIHYRKDIARNRE